MIKTKVVCVGGLNLCSTNPSSQTANKLDGGRPPSWKKNDYLSNGLTNDDEIDAGIFHIAAIIAGLIQMILRLLSTVHYTTIITQWVHATTTKKLVMCNCTRRNHNDVNRKV